MVSLAGDSEDAYCSRRRRDLVALLQCFPPDVCVVDATARYADADTAFVLRSWAMDEHRRRGQCPRSFEKGRFTVRARLHAHHTS